MATVKSRALGRRADLTLWIPPRAAWRDGRLPLAILLHGVYGSHWAWSAKGGAPRTAQRLLAAGEIAPLALAMPSDGLWGDGSGYLRHEGGDFERWIVEEVPLAAARAAPELGGWSACCIAGLSMGGFGAIRLGARHPDRFRAISAHSSLTDFSQMARFVEEPLGRYRVAPDERSLAAVLVQARSRLPPLRFDCGLEDPLLTANRELHGALVAEGIPHAYEEFTGGHEWTYWEKHLEDTLRFFSAALK